MDKSNLTMVAYEKIKQAIMLNELKFGYCISGNKISKMLNMSRTPVREAIQLLARDGLIEIQNGVGFFVKQLTITELEEITEVRRILECAALRSCIDDIPLSSLQKQTGHWGGLQAALCENGKVSLEEVRKLDTQTHNLLTHSCNNAYLREILESIELRSTRIQYLSVNPQNVSGAIDQHVEILEAVMQRDTERALGLLEKHIEFSVSYLLKHPALLDSGNGSYLSDEYLSGIFQN